MRQGTERSQCTTLVVEKCCSERPGDFYSAFVAVRALLGIKPIGSHTEHIVALDADTVDDGTDDRAGPR
jgi:hypothetical protein